MALELAWYDWVGIAGTLAVLVAFFLLQAGKLSGTGIVYQLLNLFGSGGVLVSVSYTHLDVYKRQAHIPAPYRDHDKPPESKYADLEEFLKEFQLRLPPWGKVCLLYTSRCV